ncbi:hypothetical protein [Bacteroides sp. AM10-21B]|uniref:hypothetical protein n=1 Tax=Bacteroides sp. AM10-21B TaxID=2292001 RepID=UPI000E4B9691|nr:hypothetical protein [Bacteroides sp. AM10-21B]RHJ55126.1 hypothetical protein DW121_01735 [Bacteroides sp. AM10-21B]
MPILNWVNEGLLVWRDKKKALKFSSKLQSNSADVRENTSALFDAVNIIRKFENTNEKDNELNIIKGKIEDEQLLNQIVDEIIEKAKKGSPIVENDTLVWVNKKDSLELLSSARPDSLQYNDIQDYLCSLKI